MPLLRTPIINKNSSIPGPNNTKIPQKKPLVPRPFANSTTRDIAINTEPLQPMIALNSNNMSTKPSSQASSHF